MAFDITTSKVNPALVSTGKPVPTGAVYRKARPDYGKTTESFTPPAAISDLDGYACVGYISEEGVENSFDVSSSQKKVWGGDVVLSTLDSYGEKLAFTMVETNAASQGAMWGDDAVTGSDVTDLSIDHSSAGFEGVACIVILSLKGTAGLAMQVAPQCTLSSLDSIQYTDSDLIGYHVEYDCGAGSFSDNPKCTTRTKHFAQPSFTS